MVKSLPPRAVSAIFGIFAFIDVPLVFGAIPLWRTQHPQPVIMATGIWPWSTMRKVFFFPCWPCTL
jgi:hypothetical protein